MILFVRSFVHSFVPIILIDSVFKVDIQLLLTATLFTMHHSI